MTNDLEKQAAASAGQRLRASDALRGVKVSQAADYGYSDNPDPVPHADLPPRFRRYRLSDYPGAMSKAVEPFLADDDCCSLYLWGETGSRKTSFATAILMEMREQAQCRVGCFVPAYLAVQAFRTFDDSGAKQRVDQWKTEPWLILDDLGKHRDTPHVIEQMLFLIHYRYDWAKPGHKTILTANLDLNEFAKRVDPATARRLSEGLVLELKTATGGKGS